MFRNFCRCSTDQLDKKDTCQQLRIRASQNPCFALAFEEDAHDAASKFTLAAVFVPLVGYGDDGSGCHGSLLSRLLRTRSSSLFGIEPDGLCPDRINSSLNSATCHDRVRSRFLRRFRTQVFLVSEEVFSHLHLTHLCRKDLGRKRKMIKSRSFSDASSSAVKGKRQQTPANPIFRCQGKPIFRCQGIKKWHNRGR
jgi:hypothetical protein